MLRAWLHNLRGRPTVGIAAHFVARLEAAGQHFLFFVNPETGRDNLIYDRYDGHYSLIGSAD
ncbi:MAG TPA: sigma 54 modulation/S30EA ribosomal C-terminal domain-containing protein [Streptosporangiaceae bacterium]|nr:sigma 54 modulation/S30EA ribosomal C-terminal domain-containing protein [Streptosporangiaceae bacterium]